ncbi:MAG: hypothetical protein Q8O40_12575 [Chloroflexota bacterium]|nr:hypothetical protein [Chloroflexota bacterium]
MKAIDDITLKFDWAKQCLQSLKDEVAAYIDTNPNTFEDKIEQQVGCDVVIATSLRINLEPSPRIALLLGNFLYNSRATLDHLAYYLSATNPGVTPEILRATEFPIFGNKTLYWKSDKSGRPDRRSGVWKIQAVVPSAQAIVEGLQPYHCSKGYHFDPLWKLNELCNIDKHRRLHVIQPPIGDGTLRCPGAMITKTETFFTGPLVDGTIISRCWVTLPTPDAHVEMRHYPPRDVIVNQLEILPHRVMETAGQIIQRIENDVIPDLVPFLR